MKTSSVGLEIVSEGVPEGVSWMVKDGLRCSSATGGLIPVSRKRCWHSHVLLLSCFRFLGADK